MQPYDYDALLEDHQLLPEDEDFEWCAHIVVVAATENAALEWGDHIVKDLCTTSKDVFLRSSVEPHVCGLPTAPGQKHPCPNYPALSRPGNEGLAMPVVAYGEPATAEYIGWHYGASGSAVLAEATEPPTGRVRRHPPWFASWAEALGVNLKAACCVSWSW